VRARRGIRAGGLVRGFALAAASALAAGCGDLPNAPAAGGVSTLTFSSSVGSGSGAASTEAAFRKVDRIHVRVAPVESGTPVVDDVVSVTEENGEIRLEVDVEMTGEVETFDLFLELRRGSDPLFRGSTAMQLRTGLRTPVDVNLEAVPGGIEVLSELPVFTFVGETATLEGQVVFATGDPIPGREPEWRSLDPGVADVDEGGRVTARAEGDARIEGRFGEVSEVVVAQVRLVAAEVEVEPSEADVSLGEELQLAAIVRDAGGTPLEMPVAWSSADTAVASVDAEGVVTGRSVGTTTIRAESGDAFGEAEIRVVFPPPGVVTRGPAEIGRNSAVLRGDVNPRGSAAEVWFEWGRTPNLTDRRTRSAGTLPAGSSVVLVEEELGGLDPGTDYYVRIVARNEGGTSRGQIVGFTTEAAPPTASTLAPTEVDHTSARLRANVNPRGSATQVWFELAFTPDLAEAQIVSAGTLPGGNSTVSVERTATGLQADRQYYYRVVVENDEGRATGSIVSFTTLLPPPTNLTAQQSDQSGDVFLDWSYDQESFPNVAFGVERRREGSGIWTQIDSTSETSATDSYENLEDGVTYYYRVRACRSASCSLYSDEVSITAQTPQPVGDGLPGRGGDPR